MLIRRGRRFVSCVALATVNTPLTDEATGLWIVWLSPTLT